MPEQMLADNGAPWGNPGDPYTALEVWLMRLGVRLTHGRPYHPQTQGKEERFHRTLKAEVLNRYDLLDLADCQSRFNDWRLVYNHERPHEALQDRTPATRYSPSPMRMPKVLPLIEYAQEDLLKTVHPSGVIMFKKHTFMIGRAFARLPIALRPTTTDGVFAAYFCHQKIGQLDVRLPSKSKHQLHSLT